MAEAVVAPLIPPAQTPTDGRGSRGTAGPGLRRPPLPMPPFPQARLGPLLYRLAAVDISGRVADRTALRALGWLPGAWLEFREIGGVVLVRRGERGLCAVTVSGHFHLPAAVRHWCGVQAGDRVLLVADSGKSLLVVHPPAAVEAMVTQALAAALGGDRA